MAPHPCICPSPDALSGFGKAQQGIRLQTCSWIVKQEAGFQSHQCLVLAGLCSEPIFHPTDSRGSWWHSNSSPKMVSTESRSLLKPHHHSTAMRLNEAGKAGLVTTLLHSQHPFFIRIRREQSLHTHMASRREQGCRRQN